MQDFLSAFETRRCEHLEPFLDEDILYRVEGFDPLVGRRAILAYWRRMFDSHDVVRMSLERQVPDGDLVPTAQRQLYRATRRPLLLFESWFSTSSMAIGSATGGTACSLGTMKPRTLKSGGGCGRPAGDLIPKPSHEKGTREENQDPETGGRRHGTPVWRSRR